MRMTFRWMLLCFFLLTGCQSAPAESTLYDELGGIKGIERLVDGFIYQIGFDEVIVAHFGDTDLARFRSKLIEQICELSDGPCRYSGDSMIDVHAGMNISESDFNRTVDLLIVAMDRSGVPETARNRLLARLVPLREEMIYR